MFRKVTLAAVAVLLACSFGAAQDPAALMKEPAVAAALETVKKNEPEMLDLQVRVCEIPAPEFKEQQRAAELKRLFEQYGLQNVHIDPVGNVIGTRPGSKPRPNVVLAAHLDTVFPEGTNVKVAREGTTMKAPGIGDDCRGLAAMLGVIRALKEANVPTPGTVTFVADVGEEGLGDLRGMKQLFNDMKGGIDDFISIDGTGGSITHVGVGSYRYRVTFKGPGGHSYGAFGTMANPIHAMGRAMAKIAEFQVPSDPKTTFNVGRVGGGTSVNSIPFEAWMEVDMRSPDVNSLNAVNEKFKTAVAQAVEEENKRWSGRGPVTADPALVGNRPAGHTEPDSPIVKTALEATKAVGYDARLGAAGSTDSNVPMNLGIPAITIGGGGKGTGAHSLNEQYDSSDSWRGTQRALLLVVSLAR